MQVIKWEERRVTGKECRGGLGVLSVCVCVSVGKLGYCRGGGEDQEKAQESWCRLWGESWEAAEGLGGLVCMFGFLGLS